MSERYLEDFFVEHSLPVGCESHESKSRHSPRSSIRSLSISRNQRRKTRFFRGSQRAAGAQQRSRCNSRSNRA